MPRLEIIIYDDNGKVIGRIKSDVTEAIPALIKSADPIAALAKRSGVYTNPAPHMTPEAMMRHNEALDFCRVRSDCSAMSTYATQLHDLWWMWHETPSVPLPEIAARFIAVGRAARIAYADWLATAFEAHGTRGRDARYTVKRYLASFKRGELKDTTFDAKLDGSRERLEMLRKGIK